MKNKPDPDLSGGSYLFNEIKKGYQNLVRLSLEDSGLLSRVCKNNLG
jgi:hypothetical protein